MKELGENKINKIENYLFKWKNFSLYIFNKQQIN